MKVNILNGRKENAMKNNLSDYFKLGFGFYLGYETAKKVSDIVKEIYPIIKDRLTGKY